MDASIANRIAVALERLAESSERHAKQLEEYQNFERQRAAKAEQDAEQLKRMFLPPQPLPARPEPQPPSDVQGPAGPPGAHRRRG